MFPQLDTILDISEGGLQPGTFLLITEDDCDGGVFLHHFLSTSLKRNERVVFVAIAQTFGHYNAVASRRRVSLTSYCTSDHLRFIDVLKYVSLDDTGETDDDGPMIIRDLFAAPPSAARPPPPSAQRLPSHSAARPPPTEDGSSHQHTPNRLRPLFSLIERHLKELAMVGGQPVTLFLDSVSTLVDIGFSMLDVQALSQYCQTLTSEHGANLVVVLNCEADDEGALSRSMLRNCDLVLSVCALGTGSSKDVHGVIKARNKLSGQGEKQLQYKVRERNVEFFPIGTASGVL